MEGIPAPADGTDPFECTETDFNFTDHGQGSVFMGFPGPDEGNFEPRQLYAEAGPWLLGEAALQTNMATALDNIASEAADSSRRESEDSNQAPSTWLDGVKPPPKIGTRFSRESVSVLRGWFLAHKDRPYPREDEKEMLQKQTGLSKSQISNWLVNARRRRTAHLTGRHSPSSRGGTATPPEIPQRPGTPAVQNGVFDLSPLQRWVDSTPDNEPATVTAIAKAIASENPGVCHSRCTHVYEDSPWATNSKSATPGSLSPHFAEARSDGSANQVFPDSSDAASHSSASSLSSIYSSASRSSSNLPPSRQRRKHRTVRRQRNVGNHLTPALNRFQCTFCTESFKTKYDWQRHEKSIHLPIDRWVCSPEGPRGVDENGQAYCVFCGHLDPDELHTRSHNPFSCQERLFSRKDHLKQHLRLVHTVKLVEKLTRTWKITAAPVRSRCGFCGIALDTWDMRADHLADHFKMGQTMASWKGDWGFDHSVLRMVENSIPPYLIDTESKTPAPFMASNMPFESPRNAYELIKSELTWFLHNHNCSALGIPSFDAIQLEACRIIFAAEVMMAQESSLGPEHKSWLRDVIASRGDIVQKARFSPIRSQSESALLVPKLRGQASLFEACPLESQLREFVLTQSRAEQAIDDEQLQKKASEIVTYLDRDSTSSESEIVKNWLVMLIWSSSNWVAAFRERVSDSWTKPTLRSDAIEGFGQAHSISFPSMHPDNDMVDIGGLDGSLTPASLSPYLEPTMEDGYDHRPPWVKTSVVFLHHPNLHRWLGRELGRWVAATMSPNNPNCHTPSDEELRHQARCIVYDDDDPLNSTSADNAQWLRRFKNDIGITQRSDGMCPGELARDHWGPFRGGNGLDASKIIQELKNSTQRISSDKGTDG